MATLVDGDAADSLCLSSAVSGGRRRRPPQPDGAFLRGPAGSEQALPGSVIPVVEGDAADAGISLRSGLHGAEANVQPAAAQVTAKLHITESTGCKL